AVVVPDLEDQVDRLAGAILPAGAGQCQVDVRAGRTVPPRLGLRSAFLRLALGDHLEGGLVRGQPALPTAAVLLADVLDRVAARPGEIVEFGEVVRLIRRVLAAGRHLDRDVLVALAARRKGPAAVLTEGGQRRFLAGGVPNEDLMVGPKATVPQGLFLLR